MTIIFIYTLYTNELLIEQRGQRELVTKPLDTSGVDYIQFYFRTGHFMKLAQNSYNRFIFVLIVTYTIHLIIHGQHMFRIVFFL